MKRREDWPEQLAACIDAARDRPFVWGEHDCTLFAANCVQAMTGHDYAEGYRGSYSDALSGARLIAQLGGMAAIATTALGYPVPLACVGRGDVVLLEDLKGRQSLGICLGEHSAFTGPERLELVPTLKCTTAWRVA